MPCTQVYLNLSNLSILNSSSNNFICFLRLIVVILSPDQNYGSMKEITQELDAIVPSFKPFSCQNTKVCEELFKAIRFYRFRQSIFRTGHLMLGKNRKHLLSLVPNFSLNFPMPMREKYLKFYDKLPIIGCSRA